MVFQDRWYQNEAVNFSMDDILSDLDIHPICVIPTGGGKSVVICNVVDEYLSNKPAKKVLVLSHVAKILEQNYSKLCAYFDDSFVGLYSAGLKTRELKKITVAGIQSIYKKHELLSDIGLIIIDECHLVNSDDKGMYRSFIDEIFTSHEDRVCVFGLTASPYRTCQGYLHKQYQGTKPIFNKISYDLSEYKKYNRLIEEGYLVPLIPAPVDYQMDVDGVKTTAGDYNEKDLSEKLNHDDVTKAIVEETIKYARNKYKKWLFFAIDKMHCFAIQHELQKHGIECESVYDGMKLDFDQVIEDFKNGKLRCLININMLTTGVDIPEIDLIIHARPSQSATYHIQTNGRGARPAPWIGKTHCLVLDFAGNTARHGPVNDVMIREPGDKSKGGKGITFKECKNCKTANSLRAKHCIACGEEFKTETKLTQIASKLELLKTNENKNNNKEKLEKWCAVTNVVHSIHQKEGRPSSLRVMYSCGFNTYSEWIPIDNPNTWLKAKAKKWVKLFWNGELGKFPDNLTDLYKRRDNLRHPVEILVNLDGKYPEIKDYRFEYQQYENDSQQQIEDDVPF